MKKSKWFWWGFLPFFNFAAWIHAAIRTERNSYYFNAAVYALPAAFAILLGAVEEELKIPKATDEQITNLASMAALILWFAGIAHVLLKKNTVDKEIKATEEKNQAGQPVKASGLQPLASNSSANQGETKTSNAKPDLASAQPVVIEKPAPVSMSPETVSPTPQKRKTYKYIDAQGNLIGPATLSSLRGLEQAGIVTGSTQIVNEENGRMFAFAEISPAK
jgi:hypothetical protein